MTTPVFFNPLPSPFQLVDQKDHDLQHFDDHLFLSSHNRNTSTDHDQRLIHQLKVEQYLTNDRSSDVQVFSSASSSSHEADIHNGYKSVCKREVIGDGSSTSENGSAPKWMSSKMRLMQKMVNTNRTGTNESVKIMQKLQYDQFQESNEINSFKNNRSTVRVCSDCNTTTTPLWRSGPRGPKSLCNACGIRQRKARRAMEAAAGNSTTTATTDTGSTKIKVQHNREKKSRTSHVGQYKKQCKLQDPPADQISQRNLCFNDFALSLSKNSSAFKQVFPQDVEEAAILLMELSCGFINS
ncbi:hypothetical protein ACOSP7_015619 [Xanthoceras sorbifolium]